MWRYVCEHVGRQQARVWSKPQRTSPKVRVSASGATTPTSWRCCIVPKLSESRSSFHTLQTAAITRWWTHKCSVTFKTIAQDSRGAAVFSHTRQTGGADWRRKDSGRGAPVFCEDLLPCPYVSLFLPAGGPNPHPSCQNQTRADQLLMTLFSHRSEQE